MPIFDSHIRREIVPLDMGGLFLCTDGNANLYINGNEFLFSRGTLCIICPFLFVEIVSSSADCKWEIIYDNMDVFYSLATDVFKKIIKKDILKNPIIQLDEKQIEKFMFFVDMIKAKQNLLSSEPNEEESTFHQHSITSLEQAAGFEFIPLYFNDKHDSPHKTDNSASLIYNFILSLTQNYATHHDVEWYAKQANLSTNYFSQVIRQHIGHQPSLMIKHIVVANAKILLAQRDISIKEIAAELNFRDQLTFSRYFKSCTGMSPKEYRETGVM